MNSIRNNFLYNLLYQFLSILLPLITTPYISRVLGAESLGVYSYTNSIAYYFVLVAMLGISNYGNRSVAAVRDDKKALDRVFTSIYCLQCVTYAIALVAYAGYGALFVKENKLVFLIQLVYVLSGMLDISWLYFGLEEFKVTVTINSVIKVSTACLIFMFVHDPRDLWKYTLIMSLGSLLAQAYLWIFRKRFVAFTRVNASAIFAHLKPVMILFIPVLAYSIYKVMDKIMLGQMAAYEQVGLYNSAEKIISIPIGIITALGTVMLPRMTNLISRGDAKQTEQFIRISTKIATVIASATAFGLIGISEVFTPVFFGAGYEQCVRIIQMLAGSVFFVAWANVIRTQYLIPNHLDKVYVVSTMIGAIINLFMNCFLIPKYRAVGAAVGTLMAEWSVLLVQLLATKKHLNAIKYIAESTPVLIIGSIMSLVVYVIGAFLGKNIITIGIQIVCGGLLFLVSLYACMRLKKDDIRSFGICTIRGVRDSKARFP